MHLHPTHHLEDLEPVIAYPPTLPNIKPLLLLDDNTEVVKLALTHYKPLSK